MEFGQQEFQQEFANDAWFVINRHYYSNLKRQITKQVFIHEIEIYQKSVFDFEN